MSHFQKVFLTLIFIILIANVSVVSAEDSQDQKVIITFKDEVSEKAIQQADGEISMEFDNLSVAAVTISETGIEELEKDSSILRIEQDVLVKTKAQVLDWGIQSMDIPLAWQTGYTGKGVKVAVIDSGISSHSDLLISGGASFVNYTSSYEDDNGHGTHVAGVIRATDNTYGIKGVASGVDLYAVKTMNQDGEAYLSQVIAGIDWAIENNMDIINLSLSTQSDSLVFKNIVDKAYQNGIMIVAASGNDGTGFGDTVDFPARYSSVIAVGAIDAQNRLASFSSTGPSVEVVAPGVSVLSTYLNGSYARMNGTSMAAPFISGYLALIKEAYPTLSNFQLRSILLENTQDLGLPGKDPLFGNGLIKASGLTMPLFATPSTGNPAVELNLSTQNLTLNIGNSQNINAIVKLKDGKELDVSNDVIWKSENTSIATANAGNIIGLNAGKTIISASYGGLTTSVEIEVIDPNSNSITLVTSNILEVKGQPGNRQAIELTAKRKDGSTEIITAKANWLSEDTFVAEVDKGQILLKNPGQTTIIATYENKMVKIVIQVSEKIAVQDFSDVKPSYWAYDDINWLRNEQIILGYEDNTFKPHNTIRREHVAVLLSKAIVLEESVVAKDFTDVPASYLYYQEIKKAQLAGLISGDNGYFNPKQNLTRAQMAKVLVLAFDLKKKGDHSFTDVSPTHWSNENISILYSNGISIGDNGKFAPEEPVTRAHFAAFLARSFEVQEEM